MTNEDGIKAGRLVVFSEGDYSDYGYMGAFVALKDLEVDDLRKMVEPLRAEGHRKDHYSVIALLISQGFLLEVDYTEIHVGGFGEISI